MLPCWHSAITLSHKQCNVQFITGKNQAFNSRSNRIPTTLSPYRRMKKFIFTKDK